MGVVVPSVSTIGNNPSRLDYLALLTLHNARYVPEIIKTL